MEPDLSSSFEKASSTVAKKGDLSPLLLHGTAETFGKVRGMALLTVAHRCWHPRVGL